MVKNQSEKKERAIIDGYILKQPEELSSNQVSKVKTDSSKKPLNSTSQTESKSPRRTVVTTKKTIKATPNNSKKTKINSSSHKASTHSDVVSDVKKNSEPKSDFMQQSTTTNEMSRDSIDNRSQVTDPEAAKLSRKERRLAKKKLRSRHPMPAVFRVLFSFILIAFTSVMFTWFIIWQQNLGDFDATWEFVREKNTLFSYSCLVIFLFMALIASLTWRTFFTVGLSFAAISIIMYINTQKFAIRAAPLLPEDFGMADQTGALMQFVDVWSVARLSLGIIFVMLGSCLLEFYVRRTIGQDRKSLPWWRRFAFVPRLTFTLLSVTALAMTVKPILHYTATSKEEQTWLIDLDLVGWSQTENYEKNGFVIGFLYNLGRLDVPEPEDYNMDKIRSIVDKYRQLRANDQTERKPLDEVVDNIVLVMNESFYDPEILGKHYAHTGGDVVPNLHKLFQKYPSGYMYSPEYGGNTANIEFAAYTSLSNYWANTIPYISSVSKIKPMPGLANTTRQLGFSTTAIHTYDGSTYKRDIVYQNMLFENFLDSGTMTHTKQENNQGYISDSEIYQEVLDILNDGKEKHMVGAITMQNHTPYNAAHYDELHFQLLEEVWNGEAAENSFESLHYSDQYLADFIAKLDKLEGRTIMIWFGDHAAGVLDDYVGADDKWKRDLTHFTPYFIYANFELDDLYTTTEVAKMNQELGFTFPTKGIDLPTVTPNCLANLIYDILGAKKPLIQYVADAVCSEVPVLAPTYFGNNTPDNTETLHDYELINYDILSGHRYWIEMTNE